MKSSKVILSELIQSTQSCKELKTLAELPQLITEDEKYK